jgi:hypothetical protein
MPLYRITAPNGLTYQIEGPEGASDADVAKAVMAQHPDAEKIAKPAPFSTKDAALSLGQGILGAGKSLSDVAGADNVVSETLAKGQKYLGEQMTPERQAELQRRQEKIKAAGKEGVLSEIGAELGGIAEAPVSGTLQALGSIVPYAITGGVGAVAKLLPATLRAVNTVVGALQGTGAIKGSIYDAVKDELMSGGMREDKAKEQASAAQDYLGKNIGQIALGGALGGVGARYGVEKLFEKGANEKLSESLGKRVAKAAGAEAPMEGAQGGQEQVAQNIALQREGFDVPTFQGVAGRAAGDAALGALAAGTVGAYRAPTPKPFVPPTIPKKEAPAAETPAGAQGELFTPQDLAGLKRPAGQKEELPPEAPASTEVPEGQLSLGLEAIREYADLVQERERLKREPKTPETTARIADLTQQLQDRNLYEIDRLRAEQADDAAAREQFPALAEAPLVPRNQQELFSAEEAPPGVPPRVPPAAQAEETAISEPTLRAPHQYKLPLRTVPEGKNVRRIIPEARPEAAPEPTQPGGFTEQDILDTGVPARSSLKWLQDNVVGKTKEEVQTLIDKQPALIAGKGSRAQILKALAAPEAAPYEEPTNVPAKQAGAKAGEAPARPVPPRNRKRLTLPVPPGSGVPPVESTAPDGYGVGSAGPPIEQPDVREATQPPALTEEPSEPKPKAKAGKPTTAPTPSKIPAAKPAGPTAQAVAQETPEEEAARKREAAEMADRLDAISRDIARPKPKVSAKPTATAPKVKEPTSAEIPEKLREPVGAPFGMERDEKEILRGPQGMLFPMSKREELEYAEKKQAEAEAETEAEAEAGTKTEADERQTKLDFDAPAGPAGLPVEKWAMEFSRRGLTPVYADAEVGLARSHSALGNYVYLGMLPNGRYTQYDIDRYTGDLFTPEQLERLNKARRDAAWDDSRKATKRPKGPFTGAKSNIAKTDSVDQRYANYLQELTKSLGLGDINIFLLHPEDVATLDAVDKYGLHKSYASAQTAGFDSNEEGSKRIFGPDKRDFYISFKSGMSEAKSLEVIAHELGHAIQDIAYQNADPKT